jgi:hypothetical protein
MSGKLVVIRTKCKAAASSKQLLAAGFEVFTAVMSRAEIFCVVTPCAVVIR